MEVFTIADEMARWRGGWIAGLAASLAVSSAVGQEHRDAALTLRAGVDLVLVPVTLMDRRGALVTDMTQQHFSVLQDNAPQPIVSFSREDVPCTLAIVLDTSESMAHQLSLAKQATSEILANMEPEDEVLLAGVSDVPQIKAPLTGDAASVRGILPFLKPGGNTALIDGIYLALAQLRSAHNARKALLIVSDGMDNNSGHSKSALMRMAVEADVQIYTVSIGTPSRTAKPMGLREEREGLAFLSDLSAQTGGLNYSVEFPNQVGRVAHELGCALRDQYIIGYTAARDDPSRKWHKIQIKLDVPKINVYARNGYYSR